MKSFKLYIILLAMFSAAGLYAQNYTVNGVVIDAKGNPVVGATIRTDKSKVGVMTTEGGVFSLRATPLDKKLRLVINRATVMEKEINEDIAKMPVAFEMDEKTDPVVAGYWVGDTYYPGETDKNIEELIPKILPGYNFSGSIISGGNKKYSIRVNNSYYSQGYYIEPHNIHSIKVAHSDNTYHDDGVVYITTKDYHNTTTAQESAIILSKDTIRGTVTDGWGRPAPDLKIATPSGEVTVTDDSGRYAIRVTKKDKFLRCIMPYTEGTTVRINKENWKKPINLTVMLYQNSLRGYKNSTDHTIYYPGSGETWESVFSTWPNVVFSDYKVIFKRHGIVSINGGGGPALIVLDGVKLGSSVEPIELPSVYSVKIIVENAIFIYGPEAQSGAVEIVTKGMQTAPVERTDFTALRAKQRGDMKGFIAAQGKNLEYEDGYIKVNGEVCQLYIINDHEYSHMRGIDVKMIDEIMILNDDMTKSYGPKAKHGVVLISASQKEKRVIDDEGNTVTKKEYKKAKRKK